MTTNPQTTVRVAELICETKLDQIPRDAVHYSKSLALSALGGMVAGAPIPNCQPVTRYIRRMGGNVSEWIRLSVLAKSDFLKGGNYALPASHYNAGYLLGVEQGASWRWTGIRLIREIRESP